MKGRTLILDCVLEVLNLTPRELYLCTESRCDWSGSVMPYRYIMYDSINSNPSVQGVGITIQAQDRLRNILKSVNIRIISILRNDFA